MTRLRENRRRLVITSGMGLTLSPHGGCFHLPGFGSFHPLGGKRPDRSMRLRRRHGPGGSLNPPGPVFIGIRHITDFQSRKSVDTAVHHMGGRP
ncbi:MAG: hypothetical protein AAF936_03820 [Pseudomonadota bacterium]